MNAFVKPIPELEFTKNMWASPEDSKVVKYGEKRGYVVIGYFDRKDSPNIGWYFIFDLSPYDKKEVSKVPLRSGEQIFRYATEKAMIGGYLPYIKLNLDKGLMYPLTQESFSGDIDEIKFEGRGIPLAFIRIIDDGSQSSSRLSERSQILDKKRKTIKEGLYLSKSFLLSEKFEDSSELINKIKTEDEKALGDFIKNGMFDDEINEIGNSIFEIPFLFVMNEGKKGLAKKILMRMDSDYFFKKNSSGENILQFIVKQGLIEEFNMMIQYFVKKFEKSLREEILRFSDNNGRTFLHYVFLYQIEKSHNYLRVCFKNLDFSLFYKLMIQEDNSGLSPMAYALKNPNLKGKTEIFLAGMINKSVPDPLKTTKHQLGIQSDEDFNRIINQSGNVSVLGKI